MGYCIFGPFNLAEARALSVSSPEELFFWGERIHLEDVGFECLTSGGLNKIGCNSHHPGKGWGSDEVTFINYRGAKMVLCQVVSPFEGIYIFTDDVKQYFLTGYNKLVEKKADPNSYINIHFNGVVDQLKKVIESEDVDDYTMQKIQQSGILESNDPGVFDRLRRKNLVELPENELENFLGNIFPKNIFGRNYLIGSALYYFGMPVSHLIEPALKERHDIGQEAEIITYCMKEFGAEEALFGCS